MMAGLFALVALHGAASGEEAKSRSFYELANVWSDQDGKTDVRLSDWAGRPVILTMAYTACRRVCPTATYKRMRLIQNELKQRGVQAEYVIVTLDPVADTPEVLKGFKERFQGADSHWHFLTGTKDAVKDLAGSVGFRYWEMDDHVIHDFRIWNLDSKGGIMAVMDLDHLEVAPFLNASTLTQGAKSPTEGL